MTLKVGNYTDSMGNGTETGLAAKLGVPVIDGSEGGESVGEVVARLKRINPGGLNILRAGHNDDLKLGRITHILDTLEEGMEASAPGSVVLGLGMNSMGAYTSGSLGEDVRGYWAAVNGGNAARYGSLYLPIHDMLLVHAAGQAGLTAQDREDIAHKLLPRKYRASFGNDGHYSAWGKGIYIALTAAALLDRGWPTPGVVVDPDPVPEPPIVITPPTPDPEPPVEPPTPEPEPEPEPALPDDAGDREIEALLAFIVALLQRRRKRRGLPT